MRKISEMYRLSGGTVPDRICRDCGNCRKEKNGYRCRLYEEGGGNGAWKEYFIACRFFNLPHLPESMRKPEEQPEIPRGGGRHTDEFQGFSGGYAVNAVFNYPGSKWGTAGWIIGFFPEHHSYLEPFFGSGAVLFQKSRSNIETVNDLDGNVVNLFEWIRRNPERLAHEVYYTPYARQVYEEAFQSAPEDSFQKAVNFYIRLNMGHGFRTTGERVGWKNDVQGRERAYAAANWCSLPDRIFQAAERLRGVQIENRPAVELIARFNFSNVLIYLDPPYVLNTRHGKQYRFELDDRGHNELLDAALAHKGPVLLSGYDSDLYNDRLRGWHREEITCYTQSRSKKREILWMNYEPEQQISIFDFEQEG